MNTYRAGIDIGSTTVKLVLLDEEGKLLFGEYRRHCAHTQETLSELLRRSARAGGRTAPCGRRSPARAPSISPRLSASHLCRRSWLSRTALQARRPRRRMWPSSWAARTRRSSTLPAALEERMNGVCAGGTGSFIDQMAALLQTDAAGLDQSCARSISRSIPLPRAAACLPKRTSSPLSTKGATKADLAASIFQAVVNQTISGLACGKPIRGCVAFLGGPLHFLPELKKAFIRTLKLTHETTPSTRENSHLFRRYGRGARRSDVRGAAHRRSSLTRLDKRREDGVRDATRLPALFDAQEETMTLSARATNGRLSRKGDLAGYTGRLLPRHRRRVYHDKACAHRRATAQLLFSYYANNQGSPIETAKARRRRAAKKACRRARTSCAIVLDRLRRGAC